LEQWKEFEHSGTLRTDQADWPEFLPAYQWMMHQMKTDWGTARRVTHPIWAWYQWMDANGDCPT
jgi:hypothetical protein